MIKKTHNQVSSALHTARKSGNLLIHKIFQPEICKHSSVRSFITFDERLYISPKNLIFSLKVRVGYKAISCGTKFKVCLILLSCFGTVYPLIAIEPSVASSKPQSIEINVVFPLPLGPNNPKNSP